MELENQVVGDLETTLQDLGALLSLSFPLSKFFKEDQGGEQRTSNSFKNQELGARRASSVRLEATRGFLPIKFSSPRLRFWVFFGLLQEQGRFHNK